MAKKKHRKKHHHFKAGRAQPAETRPALQAQAANQPSGLGNFSYVLADIKRTLILAVACGLLQLVLWYLFHFTGLGRLVYSLVLF
jgi:hypothetical protein